MTDPDPDIELKEKGDLGNEVGQTTDVGETSFGREDLLTDQHEDGDVHNTSAFVSGFDRGEGEGGSSSLMDELMGRLDFIDEYGGKDGDIGERMDRAVRMDMLESQFGFRPGVDHGFFSRELTKDFETVRGKKGFAIGANFKGKRVLVWNSTTKTSMLSGNKSLAKAVAKFVEIAGKAKLEWEKVSLASKVIDIVAEDETGAEVPPSVTPPVDPTDPGEGVRR